MSYLNQRLSAAWGGTGRGGADGRLNRQQALLVSVETGVSPRVSLQGLLPLRSVDLSGREEISSSGFGDAELTARVALTRPEGGSNLLAVGYGGISVQTGRDPDRTSLETNAQLSRDQPALLAGAEGAHAVGESSEIYGRIDTLIPFGDSRGYRFGATRSGAILFTSRAGSSGLSWLAGPTWRYAGRDTLDGRAVESRGGRQTRLAAGIVVSLGETHRLGLLAERLISADLPGDQLVARTEFVLGWQATFGGSR